MRGNIFGKMLSMTSFGESHGPAIGVVLDGVPPNLTVSLEDLQKELDRRAPGQKGTTPRKEADKAEILSGVFEGKTLGTPIAVIVRNEAQRSGDYDKLKDEYRPGHADKTTMLKYGIRDHRGGGRSSGRETIARVIAGYFASLILPDLRVEVWPSQIASFAFKDISSWAQGRDELASFLDSLRQQGESVGGRVSIRVKCVPAGLGEPAFDKLKADLAKALLSIGGVTSFSYGAGEEFAHIMGQAASANPSVFGGMEGGISNGDDLTMNITFKPTSTVGDKAKAGRHDPCIIPRALPVVEAMVKVVLADHYLRQKAYTNA